MQVCLITGAGGFIGSHLAELLASRGCRVVGTVHHERRHIAHLAQQVDIRPCDVTDRPALTALFRETSPDVIFHLAAQDLIQTSWDDPEGTIRTNVLGSLAVLEAARDAVPNAIIQIAGSSAEYGPGPSDASPISEERPPQPRSPYGASKAAAVHLARLYAWRHGLRVHCIRPFQFIGPRKFPDACSEFARGIVAIERGLADELRVGSLEAVRDMLDVRDGARAMWLIAGAAQPGDIYNVCAGVGLRIGIVLARLIALSGVTVHVRTDPAKVRPLDEPVIVGDNTKLCRLGWQPAIRLEQTLAEILAYWRQVAL